MFDYYKCHELQLLAKASSVYQHARIKGSIATYLLLQNRRQTRLYPMPYYMWIILQLGSSIITGVLAYQNVLSKTYFFGG